ncbi:thioesterase family protein [Nocardiopsis suaedae]|uniref:Thioesterase family protein n=1 Tax=Nocardiopsis suaedae TaxID=3018444 RepID=A0ABT4TV37_9ACTN|nr:thioesterase family protein [Nocardiopsis suaedae]MDA2808070.1 thioesterase family protein [Nocardiopsis suaedae]
MADFTAATALTGPPAPRPGAARHAFTADLDPQWAVGDKLHGGYLMAVMGRAAARSADGAHPDLAAMAASFIRPPLPGPAEVEVETLRAGKGTTRVRVRLSQDGAPCVEALATNGALDGGAPYWSRTEPAALPPEHDCVPSPAEVPGSEFRVPLMEAVDQRIDPDILNAMAGRPSMRGRVAGWQRLADGAAWDPLSLLVALDMVPPVSYDLGMPGWAPTVQMSAYIRAVPAPGPVRVAMQAEEVSGDRMDVTATAWDAKDRLVAQASQIAAVRTPD